MWIHYDNQNNKRGWIIMIQYWSVVKWKSTLVHLKNLSFPFLHFVQSAYVVLIHRNVSGHLKSLSTSIHTERKKFADRESLRILDHSIICQISLEKEISSLRKIWPSPRAETGERSGLNGYFGGKGSSLEKDIMWCVPQAPSRFLLHYGEDLNRVHLGILTESIQKEEKYAPHWITLEILKITKLVQHTKPFA